MKTIATMFENKAKSAEEIAKAMKLDIKLR